MKPNSKMVVAAVAGAFICGSSVAVGAELKMIGNPGMSEIMAQVAPEFEKSSGHRIHWQLGLFQTLKPLIDQRDFDVIVTTGEVADYAAHQKAVSGELANVAQVGIGVAIKTGAPKPDISTVDAFKRALLSAKSISYTGGSTAGKYLENLMERLGIAEEMKPKTKILGGGGQTREPSQPERSNWACRSLATFCRSRGLSCLGHCRPKFSL